MQQALNDAGLLPCHVDHINAHATSTPRGKLQERTELKNGNNIAGDAAEAAAIARLLQLNDGSMQRDVSVTSVKGAIGHLLGAAGLRKTQP